MSIQVAIRVRPLSKEEKVQGMNICVTVEGNDIHVTPPILKKVSRNTFTFDHCFGPSSTQEDVFAVVGVDIVNKLMKGYSCSILAYGQTGSGKSHTMLGPVQKHTPRYAPASSSARGIIPRICEHLLRLGKLFEVRYYELYNEKVKDLLSDQPLRIREHPQFGPFVDCPTRSVQDLHEAVALIELGNKWRKTASTQMNYISSRSHAIFEVRMDDCVLYLADLAGSERGSGSSQFERVLETSNINKSLLHLGKVIQILSDAKPGQPPGYIPYRDSILTWLLRDSFGGNSCTFMISTVTPHDVVVQETLSTLRYSSKATKIINCPVAGSHATSMTQAQSDSSVVKHMRSEIIALRGQLQVGSDVTNIVKDVTKQFEEKLLQAERMMESRERERENLIRTLKLKTDLIERLEDDVTSSRKKQEENEKTIKMLEQEWQKKQRESPVLQAPPAVLQVELLHKRLTEMEERFEAQMQMLEFNVRKSATPDMYGVNNVENLLTTPPSSHRPGNGGSMEPASRTVDSSIVSENGGPRIHFEVEDVQQHAHRSSAPPPSSVGQNQSQNQPTRLVRSNGYQPENMGSSQRDVVAPIPKRSQPILKDVSSPPDEEEDLTSDTSGTTDESEEDSDDSSSSSSEEDVSARISNMVQRSVAAPSARVIPTPNTVMGSRGVSPRMAASPQQQLQQNNSNKNTVGVSPRQPPPPRVGSGSALKPQTPPSSNLTPQQTTPSLTNTATTATPAAGGSLEAQNGQEPPKPQGASEAPPTQRSGLGPSPRIPSLSPLRGLLSSSSPPSNRQNPAQDTFADAQVPPRALSPEDYDYDAEHEKMHELALRNKKLAEQQSMYVRRMLESNHVQVRQGLMAKSTAVPGSNGTPMRAIRIQEAVEIVHPDNRVEYRVAQISPRPDLKRIQQKYHDAMKSI
eukprot:PhF_6_TR37564/c0_g1_i1/m.55656